MKFLSAIILFFISSNLYSQVTDSLTPCSDRTFRNQGEQEKCLSEQFFEKEYVNMKFEEFKSDITEIDQSTIKFGEKILLSLDSNKEFSQIFLKGIFYPQLLIGHEKIQEIKFNDSTSEIQRLFSEIAQGSDTLKISSLEELKFLNSSPQVKRFRFWVYWHERINLQVYFIELTNEKANLQTNFSNFIEGARLTFLKGAWVSI